MPTPTGAWIPEAGFKKCKSDGLPLGWQASYVTEVLPTMWETAWTVLSRYLHHPDLHHPRWTCIGSRVDHDAALMHQLVTWIERRHCLQEQVLLAAVRAMRCLLLHLMVKSQNPDWSSEGTELATQTLTGTLQSLSIESPAIVITPKIIPKAMTSTTASRFW
jgi:hypothetical protein